MPRFYYLVPIFILLFVLTTKSQNPNPTRFQSEIEAFNRIEFDNTKDIVVFTGSSSIRLWKDLNEYYLDHQIINTGFGGSHMSDLLYYIEETIIRFNPTKVFIYEGDNDIANGISESEILKYTHAVIDKIHKKLPNCNIFIIAPKPSIARWSFKEEYLSICRALENIANRNEKVSFINVWNIMLDSDGELKDNLFVEDNLHMNKNGYDLWDKLIAPLLN